MPNIVEIPVEFKRLFADDWREAAIYGGRYSLKSHSVARAILMLARKDKKRVACFREFQNSIAESSHQLLSDLIDQYGLKDFKVTDNSIVNTINGSDFLFKGLRHNEQSIKSIEGIDIAWVEEAQTISNTSIEVLTPTVRKPGSRIIYTYNRLREADPVHQRLVIEGRPNTLIINANNDIAEKYGWLPDVIKSEIEDDKLNRPALYEHKWMGEPNNLSGRIYKDWKIIDEIPHEAQLVRRGLDFGYTNDPSAIVAIYRYNGGYIIDEEMYLKGMLNSDIASKIKNLPNTNTLIVGDSAEPKSIAELQLLGINIIGVEKKGYNNKSFLHAGIDYVQQQRISITRRSTHGIPEYQGYMWMVDKEGNPINEPEGGKDHFLDATRYGFEGLREKKEEIVVFL